MLLARAVARSVRSNSIHYSLSQSCIAVWLSHTININLTIGKDVHIEGTGADKIINKQIDRCSNTVLKLSEAFSVRDLVDSRLLQLNNSQLQQLLVQRYGLAELSNFVKEHKLTGTNLFYGVESVNDLETLGLNRIQARTLFHLIHVWKEQGLPQQPLADAASVNSQAPIDETSASTSVTTQESAEVSHQLNQWLESLKAADTPTNESILPMSSHTEEETAEPDAELMEWYAQLDIAFINARWGGQTHQAHLIQQAAESAEDFLAEAYWSILCEKGCPGVDKNHLQAMYYARRALPWLLQEASNGNPYAQYNLGFCYTDGRGVPHDPVKAVQLYELAAAQGHQGARVNLGISYEHGEGVEKDPVMAVSCFKGAYTHPHALHSYAYCLRYGIGLEKSPDLAHFYCKEAADLGHADAQYMLGKFYSEDPDVSDMYLRMAAAQGHKEALSMFGQHMKE